MKQTIYLLENNSYSLGSYRIGDEEFTLSPRSTVRELVRPNTTTANISVCSFVEEVEVKVSKSAPKVEAEDKGE